MRLARRTFLGGLACVGLWLQSARAETAADGFLVIRAKPMQAPLLGDGGAATDIWGFAGSAVINARQGQELKLRFVNELPDEIWLHFFGVRGPSELMTINVPPGEGQAVDCVFTPPDAGTFWIGPVADASKVRDMGLVAMLVVEEANRPANLIELPLILDDWKLEEGGAVEGGFGDIEAMVGEGRLGNWFTVNNLFRPKLALKAGQFTRLRFLNAANVRNMGLLFKGHDPLLVALDGQPVKPRLLDQKALVLAPGQRADLLASPEDGDITLALDLFEDIVEIAYLVRDGDAAPPAIPENFALPPNPAVAPGPAGTVRTVRITIEGGIKGGLKSAKFRGETMDLRALLENGKGWVMNGAAGPTDVPLFTAAEGETVVLAVENRTAFAQAIHIHGHVWQEVSADAGEAAPLRDTAVIAPGKTLNLAFVADNPGTWAIQSLVAERADGGLIAPFQVTARAPLE